MPVADWQFWVVTLFVLGAVALLVRQLKPVGRRKRKTPLTISARRKH